jgi:hypothetical protein
MTIPATRYTKRISVGLSLRPFGIAWAIGDAGKLDYGAICWTRYGWTSLFRRAA